MTDPVVDGVGDVKTYISGTVARATVAADVRLTHTVPPPDDTVEHPSLAVRTAGFDTEDYYVIGGQPTGQPLCAVRMRSRAGIGVWEWSDVPPAPADVDTGATCRWLPTDATFAPDGTYWLPVQGSALQLTASSDAGLLTSDPPYLDDNYSFSVRGGDEVSLPAVIIDGNAFMRLAAENWTTQAFTFVLVAVMHQNPEGPIFGVLESLTPFNPDLTIVPDPDEGAQGQVTDWGLRYRQGSLELYAGSTVLSHQVTLPQARAMVIGISMDAQTGRLLVCDRSKSTRSFSTDGYSLYNIDMLVGATNSGDEGETAYMDVLELNYYDHALDFEDFSEVLHQLDAVYGVVD